jgi:hypothetical protein
MSCIWYGTTCLEKKCDGEGFVACRIKERGTSSDKVEGEYKKITIRNPQKKNIPCLSCLEKTAYNSKIYVSA